MSDTQAAADAAIAEKKDKGYGSITFDGVEYPIERKPSSLLLAEMARTGTGDPDAIGVLADFFESTLGSSYPKFKRAVFRADDEDIEKILNEKLTEVLEKTMGRPTE